MRYYLGILALTLLPLASVFAQPVSLGSVAGTEATSSLSATTIDMSHPATAAGSVTTAHVRWSANGPCTGSLKLKVVRLDVVAGVFNVVADRGPFTVTTGANRLTLTPAVDVLAGDLLATVVLPSCGAVAATHARYGDFTLTTSGDFASGKAFASFNLNRETRPLAQLTSDSTLLAGVIPAAGSVAGGFGSFFRTSLQLANPGNTPSVGRIVFHPQGFQGRTDDPFRPFSLQPFATSTHPDIGTEMGLSGKGSIDIIVTNGGPAPVVTARIFDDKGDSGTAGFYEDMVAPADMLHGGDAASFILPGDPANFRTNAGVRTLTPTTFSVNYYDTAGLPLGGTNFKSYAANWYEQADISSFVGGQPIIPGGLIVVKMISGDAVIYFSITDNRTNDTSATILQIPK